MSKDREKQKADKAEKIHTLQLEMRQAYRQNNPKLADEIMSQIRELRGNERKVDKWKSRLYLLGNFAHYFLYNLDYMLLGGNYGMFTTRLHIRRFKRVWNDLYSW